MKRVMAVAGLIVLLLASGCALTSNTVPSVSAAAEGKVRVDFSASPGPAEIWIDRAFIGSTPLDYYLAPGTYNVELRKQGYATWTRQLVVREGNPTRVSGELEKR